MKLVGIIGMGILIALISMQIVSFWGTERKISGEIEAVRERFQAATIDQVRLQEDFEYYSNSENLEKELRARFNYKHPDEKLIIIVPRNQPPSTPTSTTAQ